MFQVSLNDVLGGEKKEDFERHGFKNGLIVCIVKD